MWPILLLLVLLVAAIASFVQLGNLDKLPAIETGAQPAEGTTVMEPVRKGIRDVTPPSVLRPPPPDEDRIARLPALIVPTPKRPAKPDY